MNKYIFPVILIVLQIGAGVVSALERDRWFAVYWFSAAILNFAVVKMG